MPRRRRVHFGRHNRGYQRRRNAEANEMQEQIETRRQNERERYARRRASQTDER